MDPDQPGDDPPLLAWLEAEFPSPEHVREGSEDELPSPVAGRPASIPTNSPSDALPSPVQGRPVSIGSASPSDELPSPIHASSPPAPLSSPEYSIPSQPLDADEMQIEPEQDIEPAEIPQEILEYEPPAEESDHLHLSPSGTHRQRLIVVP